MLYTAITRGIETIVLIGDIDQINEVVSTFPRSLDREHGLRFQGV
jgi:exodeoxyribonuclease V alpha subunit